MYSLRQSFLDLFLKGNRVVLDPNHLGSTQKKLWDLGTKNPHLFGLLQLKCNFLIVDEKKERESAGPMFIEGLDHFLSTIIYWAVASPISGTKRQSCVAYTQVTYSKTTNNILLFLKMSFIKLEKQITYVLSLPCRGRHEQSL